MSSYLAHHPRTEAQAVAREPSPILPGSPTPWGPAETVTQLGDRGAVAVAVTTSSHGGIYLPPALNALVSAEEKTATWNARGLNGWYEEDVDWSVVAYHFPELFTREQKALAMRVRVVGQRRHAASARGFAS